MRQLIIFDFAGTIDSGREEKNIIESIKNLSSKYFLAIVSSTSSSYIKSYLKERGAFSSFSDILGSDFALSKLERMKNLFEKYNLTAQDAVLVTDTLGDITEAKEIGMNSIAVTWGLDDRKTLEKGKPVAIIDDPRELENAINNVLK